MTSKKFIVHVSGPICAGKSTVEEAVGKRFPGAYLITYDKLKWQLFGYDRNRQDHRKFLKTLQWGLFEIACGQSVPVISDLFFHDEEEYGRFVRIAQQHGYEKRVFVRLVAPQDVLLKRFRERVRHAEETGGKISPTDENVFLSLNSSNDFFIPPGALVFDTSLTNAEAITKEVARLLEPDE